MSIRKRKEAPRSCVYVSRFQVQWKLPKRFVRMLGICCVSIMDDEVRVEFAVLSGIPRQGKGIGIELLKCCMILAKGGEVETVWDRILPWNEKMLALERKLGFTLKQVPDDNEHALLMDIRKIP